MTDYLHSKNKYVRSDSLKLNDSYKKEILLNRVFSVIIFIVLAISAFFTFNWYNNAILTINNTQYKLVQNVELDVNDEIIVTNNADAFYSKLLVLVNNDNAAVAELLALPFGSYVDFDQEYHTIENEYLVRYNNEIKVVNKEDILGRADRTGKEQI